MTIQSGLLVSFTSSQKTCYQETFKALPRDEGMNEDTLNMEIRRFLKRVGITSQREIEHAVHAALEQKMLTGNEKLAIKMTLEMPVLGLKHTIDGQIGLE